MKTRLRWIGLLGYTLSLLAARVAAVTPMDKLDAVTMREMLADRLGSTHAAGKYAFDPEYDFLNEGAIEISHAGMRVIKLWFVRETPSEYYKWNSHWPYFFDSLKVMAEHPYYREVLRRPFDTYVLTIFEERLFHDGFDEARAAALEQDFYDLARHLLETYRGTGKTFILGTWEGDWMLRRNTHTRPEGDPSPTAIAGMIRWYNARQAGIDRARRDSADSDVRVYGAAEVNLVKLAMQGRPTVTNDVLPFTNMDLVSYSCYDTITTAITADEAAARREFAAALRYLAERMPDTSTPGPDGRPFGDKNIFISEFGCPGFQHGDQLQEIMSRLTVEEATAFGCPWIIYWQVYDNECRQPNTADGNVLKTTPKEMPMVDDNSLCRGFWLRRPDGTHSSAWKYFTGLLRPYGYSPDAFHAVPLRNGPVVLTWAAVQDADRYRLERSVDGGEFTLLAELTADQEQYDDTDVHPERDYRYRMRAERAEVRPAAWYYTDTISLAHVPFAPTGPNLARPDTPVIFEAVGPRHGSWGRYEYRFDWGDGYCSQWTDRTAEHRWSTPGVYQIKIQARLFDHDGRVVGDTALSDAVRIAISQSDFDGDGDVDLADFDLLQACLGQAYVSGKSPCAPADLNHDKQIDIKDFEYFLPCYAGADNPPGC